MITKLGNNFRIVDIDENMKEYGDSMILNKKSELVKFIMDEF